MRGPRRTNTQTEGRHIPRCSCGRYRRLGIGQHRRVDRRDARGTHRVFTSSILSHPGLCHALVGVASHPRRVSRSILETATPVRPATAECDAPPGGRWFRRRKRLQNACVRSDGWLIHGRPLTSHTSILSPGCRITTFAPLPSASRANSFGSPKRGGKVP